MKVTSAEANKLIRRLEENKMRIEDEEKMMATYHAATSEDEKALRPEYDFFATQKAIDVVDAQIRRLRHAINKFNCSTELEGTGLTIDQALVKLPQLQRKRSRLERMRNKLPKDRFSITGNIIDYVYTSYDPQDAVDEYTKTIDEIAKIQLLLDEVNVNIYFDVDDVDNVTIK